jgi:hypothetical protein
MKKQYKITGLYYQIQGFKFRKHLDIKNVKSSCKTPDLMVIMMNPGGSYPIDGIDNNTIASEAIPDRTQSQIIQVMQNAGFNYARVINLSDIREPKSNLFYNKIAELNTKGIAHSIFDDTRKEDLSQLWVNTATVIFGWGVSVKLKPLALKAIAACSASNPYGILKANTNWAYYHPLPQIYKKQLEWIETISNQIKD